MSCGQCVNEAGLTLASSGVALPQTRALFGVSQRCAECGAFLDGRGQCNNPDHGRKVRAADAGFDGPVRISPYDRLDEITEEIMGHRKIGVISLATGEDGRWADGRLNFRGAGDLEMAEPGVRLVDRDTLTTFGRAGSGAWLPPERTTPVQIYEAVWELDDRGLSLEAIGEQGKAKVRGEVGRGANVEPRDLFVELHPREERTVVVATYQVIE